MFSFSPILIASLLPILTNAQTWCGKHYMQGSSVVPPGGEFVFPPTSSKPLLNFQCTPGMKPYLKGDNVSLIIDTRITSSQVPGAAPLPQSTGPLTISVVLNGQIQVLGTVPLNTTGTEFPISTKSLPTSSQPYTINCLAHASDQTEYVTSAQLSYLSPPASGSVVKQDYSTGVLYIQNGSSTFTPTIPVGFYTNFAGYLDNVANIDAVRDRGFQVMNVVPDGAGGATFGTGDQFNQALAEMEKVGIWYMHDMRYTYQDAASVTQQVNMIKSFSKLLSWYTGDEPDGTSDPLDATFSTKALINSLDGYNHPTALVLNCEDYFFANYSKGADILLQDTYTIGNNCSFSSVWHTPCTTDFGDCGCDNCQGNLEDIAVRVEDFKQRLDALGRSRTTAVWSVTQGFGQDTYWPREPTQQEVIAQGVVALNHGSTGLLSWVDPAPSQVRGGMATLANLALEITEYLATPSVTINKKTTNGVDATSWQLPGSSSTSKSLMMIVNTNQRTVSVTLSVPTSGAPSQILNAGIQSATSPAAGQLLLKLNATASAAYIVQGGVSVKSVTLD